MKLVVQYRKGRGCVLVSRFTRGRAKKENDE
ncbi:hypothetical protein BH09BAC4_BH09BAC4_37830 [soil metagenome]